jgi:hypothetical protein
MGNCEMKYVWVVTTGEYSDYRISDIFAEDDEDMARAYAASLDDGDADVRQWELTSGFDVNQVFWQVHDWMDDEYGIWLSRVDAVPAHSTVNKFRLASDRDGAEYWEGWVRAPTKEHARKIAGEQIARAKTEQAGMR